MTKEMRGGRMTRLRAEQRDAELIDVLVADDLDYIINTPGGDELLYHILYEGHVGYDTMTTTELEDEIKERGLVMP